jgi:hypothetical protein
MFPAKAPAYVPLKIFLGKSSFIFHIKNYPMPQSKKYTLAKLRHITNLSLTVPNRP